MKKIFLITLLFLFLGCYNDERLKINELNFSDLNQKSILKNKIKKTFLISGFDSGLYKENDTISIVEYNRIGKTEKVWRKSLMYSINEEYKYDSLNLETKKIYFTDFKAMFSFRYEFNKDSLVLYKYYTKPSFGFSKEDFTIPAGIFKFNDNGNIVESFEYQNNDYGKGKRLLTKYYYDTSNNLMSKEILYKPSNTDDIAKDSKEITDYYYSNKKLDSATSTFSWTDRENQEQSYTISYIYDDNKLISKSIAMDSLVTYYKHIKY